MSNTSEAKDQLRSIVERIERLEEEKKAISDDIKDVYLEAKSNGFDPKALRWAVAERKLEEMQRQERDAMRDLYAVNLGLQPDLFEDQAA